MTDTNQSKPKFTRRPMSQETKDKIAASRLNKKHSQETKDKMSQTKSNVIKPRTQQSKQRTKELYMSKALEDKRFEDFIEKFISTFAYGLIRAEDNENLYQYFIETFDKYTFMKSSNGKIYFNLSIIELRNEYGHLAEKLFRRLFINVKRGGFSLNLGEGYKTAWTVNRDGVDKYIMNIISLKDKDERLKAFNKLFNNSEELYNRPTEFEITEDIRLGKKIISPVKSSKRLISKDELKEVNQKRKDKEIELNQINKKEIKDKFSKIIKFDENQQ